jgi:glucose dehydrogenase
MLQTPFRFLSALALASTVVASVAAQNINSKDLLDGLANPSRWLTHSGDYFGQRFSRLTQITPANAEQLAAQWTFQTGVVNKFEATPIVIDGVLYVTGALNHAWAIDGRTGKQIWHYQRTLPQGLKVCCAMPAGLECSPPRAASSSAAIIRARSSPRIRTQGGSFTSIRLAR